MTRFRASLALLALAAPLAIAEQFGDFTYVLNDDETVTITNYPKDAVGHVDIPAEIDGMPVTALAPGAFGDCRELTSITIPAGVTDVEGRGVDFFSGGAWGTFGGCTSLTTILVDGANPALASEDGVLLDRGKTTIIEFPQGKAGPYILPASVTEIRAWTFFRCPLVTSITIPAATITIHEQAFTRCPALEAIMVDEGNPNYATKDGVLFDATMTTLIRCPEGRTGTYSVPPSVTTIQGVAWREIRSAPCHGGVFGPAPPGCTTPSYGRTGIGAFANCQSLSKITISPGVNRIDEAIFADCTSLALVEFLGEPPFSGWWPLLEGSFYRAPLDLRVSLPGRAPQLVMESDSMLMVVDARHDSAIPGGISTPFSYSVETSTDLRTWTTEGVTLGELRPDGLLPASVSRQGPNRFLRVVIRIRDQARALSNPPSG